MNHILAIRFSALGDVAMTLPVLYSVAERYPDTRFTFVTRPFFARLFINPPSNLTVLPIDLKEYKGAGGLWRLFRRLSRLHPTAVADLHNVLRTWVIDSLFRLSDTRVAMVDKKRSDRARSLAGRVSQDWFVNRYLKVFASLGFPAKLTFRSLSLPAETTLPDIEPGAVGIAPFARYMTKTYPPDLMHRVVEKLAQNRIPVYLFGSRGKEAETLERWSREIPGTHSLAGKYTLEEELALMSRLRLMVSMDSANQHLASLVALPIVTIWGATVPSCGFEPYSVGGHTPLLAATPCQPCSVAGSEKCRQGHLSCMYGLTPETVTEKILALCRH